MAPNFIGYGMHRTLECQPRVIIFTITLEICIIFPPSHMCSSHATLGNTLKASANSCADSLFEWIYEKMLLTTTSRFMSFLTMTDHWINPWKSFTTLLFVLSLPSMPTISVSGESSIIAFEEKESASCQWIAMLMPSSFAVLKVRHAAYPSGPLDVPGRVPHLSQYLLSIKKSTSVIITNTEYKILMWCPCVIHAPSADVTAQLHEPSSSWVIVFVCFSFFTHSINHLLHN